MDCETELDQTDEIRLEASTDRYRVVVTAEDGTNRRAYSDKVEGENGLQDYGKNEIIIQTKREKNKEIPLKLFKSSNGI